MPAMHRLFLVYACLHGAAALRVLSSPRLLGPSFSPKMIAIVSLARSDSDAREAELEDEATAREAERQDSDVDSADSGPKILMPPADLLGVMPSDADSFTGYLAPYAVLILGAFALASGAFALLVLQG